MMQLRFCKDCRWAMGGGHKAFMQCMHVTALIKGEIDLVTGDTQADKQASCQVVRAWERNYEDVIWCGPEGKFWEPREEFSGTIGFGVALTSDDFDKE